MVKKHQDGISVRGVWYLNRFTFTNTVRDFWKASFGRPPFKCVGCGAYFKVAKEPKPVNSSVRVVCGEDCWRRFLRKCRGVAG